MPGEWSGEERRDGFCPVHHIKCGEWKATEKKVDELEKTKVSVKVFQIVITILLTVGGGYWYTQDMNAKEYFISMMEMNTASNKNLEKHINTSNIILRNMSKDVREVKLNQNSILKKLNLDRQEIPGYYGSGE